MAKQGERYNPKTKTGWKFENGRTVYYKKGKILNNRQQLLSLGKQIFDPLISGAQTIRDKLRISRLSETGESVFEYNKKQPERDSKIAYQEEIQDKMTQEQANLALRNYNFQKSQQEETAIRADREGQIDDLIADAMRRFGVAQTLQGLVGG